MLSLPFAVEASWVTGKWTKLEQYLISSNEALQGDFNVGIGRALLALFHKEFDQFSSILNNLRLLTAKSLSITNTTSLQVCHEALLKFHVIMEIEAISGVLGADERGKQSLLLTMNQRLDLLGASGTDKQYLLGLRRASMQLSK